MSIVLFLLCVLYVFCGGKTEISENFQQQKKNQICIYQNKIKQDCDKFSSILKTCKKNDKNTGKFRGRYGILPVTGTVPTGGCFFVWIFLSFAVLESPASEKSYALAYSYPLPSWNDTATKKLALLSSCSKEGIRLSHEAQALIASNDQLVGLKRPDWEAHGPVFFWFCVAALKWKNGTSIIIRKCL